MFQVIKLKYDYIRNIHSQLIKTFQLSVNNTILVLNNYI